MAKYCRQSQSVLIPVSAVSEGFNASLANAVTKPQRPEMFHNGGTNSGAVTWRYVPGLIDSADSADTYHRLDVPAYRRGGSG